MNSATLIDVEFFTALWGLCNLFVTAVWGWRLFNDLKSLKADSTIRCHIHERILDDWLEKNRIIHRLEKRVCQLKRANRNLREEVKRIAALEQEVAALKEQIGGFPIVDALREAMIDTANLNDNLQDELVQVKQENERRSAPVSVGEMILLLPTYSQQDCNFAAYAARKLIAARTAPPAKEGM